MRSSPLFVVVATALIFVAFAAFAHASKESASCFYFPGRNYTSARVIKSQVSANAYGCCKLCDDTAGCAAATYISKTHKCVMVADNTQFTDNVQGLFGVLDTAATPQPTPQPSTPQPTPHPTPAPTPHPTPAPTPSPAGDNIGVLTCCLSGNSCSVLSDRTCISYGSECGKCVNGIPYDQRGQVYYCPRYTRPQTVNDIKSYRFDCNNSTNLKVKVFTERNCRSAPKAVVESPYDSCTKNNVRAGFSQASVIKGPPSSTSYIDQVNCYGLDSMCEKKCNTNKIVPGGCTYAQYGHRPDDLGQSVIAQYYGSAKKVTYATYGDDTTCQNSTHAMFVEPEGPCFMAYGGYTHKNSAARRFDKK